VEHLVLAAADTEQKQWAVLEHSQRAAIGMGHLPKYAGACLAVR
jgi:hypothetical protein